jgi:hypothetical protein
VYQRGGGIGCRVSFCNLLQSIPPGPGPQLLPSGPALGRFASCAALGRTNSSLNRLPPELFAGTTPQKRADQDSHQAEQNLEAADQSIHRNASVGYRQRRILNTARINSTQLANCDLDPLRNAGCSVNTETVHPAPAPPAPVLSPVETTAPSIPTIPVELPHYRSTQCPLHWQLDQHCIYGIFMKSKRPLVATLSNRPCLARTRYRYPSRTTSHRSILHRQLRVTGLQ